MIAELGTSHGGDISKARELITSASEAGADCIKFQMVYADEILHPLTGELDLPGGRVRLYDRFRALEVPDDFYLMLKEEVEALGLIFLCTPFGIRSARKIRDLGVSLIKIASPELNYTSLLRETASYRLPTLLSTGVSTLGDIETALGFFGSTTVCLLHCVTAYPAPPEDYNLRLLPNMRGIFGCPVGLSDHSLDPVLIPALGAALGAAAVEKHFCLSRNGPGLDDPIALPPEDFSRMVKKIRELSLLPPEAALSQLRDEKGPALVEAALGTGVKSLAQSEEANYGRSNRSLHATVDIEAGDLLTRENTGVLRTEKLLRPGLPPSWEEKVIGRKAARFIPAGEGIRFEDI